MTIEEMSGKTMLSVVTNDENRELVFISTEEDVYTFYHDRDCCERVFIEDITGDLNDLCGAPLLRVEKRSKKSETGEGTEEWTFYEFATIKGSVTVRWYGESNGYYSTDVSLYIQKKENTDG